MTHADDPLPGRVGDPKSRGGFTYGTLPGHPECGEETFALTQEHDGDAVFEVRAYSRPGHPLILAVHPSARVAQLVATDRYLHAMRTLATDP